MIIGKFYKFLLTGLGRKLLSITLGIGISALFRESCKGKNCYIYVSPDFESLENDIYSFNEKCYTFKREGVKCNSDKQTINA